MKLWAKMMTICLLAFMVTACTKKPGPIPISTEDSPIHHYLQGMEAIDKGQFNDAAAKFDRALYFDKKYAPALAGKALTLAIQAGKQTAKEHQEVDINKALDILEESEDYAEDDNEEFIYHVTAIRVYTHGHPKKWLKKAKKHYKSAIKLEINDGALPYYQTVSAAHYFMGIAYYKGYKFGDSQDVLFRVTSAKPDKWHDKADSLYKKVQKIVRASSQYTLTNVAAKIAVKDEVTRGDVAALLIDEIHLDRFLAGRIPIKSQQPKVDFVPSDAMTHPFKDEITIITKWNVRGLEAQYDKLSRAYLFNPQGFIKRKELAFILEDLIIKLTGDEKLARAYFGYDRSPFPDVPPHVAWFNAVMNANSRGLMEPELSGEFRPDDYVVGAEIILAIMKLRNVVNNY